MGAVKDMLMDVEDFVYDFYTEDGELTASPETIVKKAINKFGPSFGNYAEDVINNNHDMEPHWDWNSNVPDNSVGVEV
jgi:hypothetical protein